MITATLAYLGLVVIFASVAPRLAARADPAWGVRLIVPAMIALTGAGLFVLAANALTWAAQLADIAEVGDWSAHQLRRSDPVPHLLAGLSAVLLTASIMSMTAVAVRRVRTFARVPVPAGDGDLGEPILLEDDRAEAFTTPGRRGRIVVTSALMNALSGSERAALIAHERSHQRHRHAWWLLIADLAAAGNPLLRGTARVLAHVVERWADEDAAVDVGDRTLVARTVARASILRKRTAQNATALVLSVADGDAPARVRALLSTRPRRISLAVAALALLVAAAAFAAIVMERSTDAVFDAAHRG
jgi:Zn-dependent protease with chaperone function